MSAADQLDDDDDTSSLIRSCLDAATSTVVLTAPEFRCVADGLLDLLRRYAMSDGVLQIALVPLDRIEVQDAPSVLQRLVNATHSHENGALRRKSGQCAVPTTALWSSCSRTRDSAGANSARSGLAGLPRVLDVSRSPRR